MQHLFVLLNNESIINSCIRFRYNKWNAKPGTRSIKLEYLRLCCITNLYSHLHIETTTRLMNLFVITATTAI